MKDAKFKGGPGVDVVMDSLVFSVIMNHIKDGSKHKDVRPTQITDNEKYIKQVQEAGFIILFEVENKVYIILKSSGAPDSHDVQYEILRAETARSEAKEIFIKERLEKQDKFVETIKNMNLKTMIDIRKDLC